MKTIELTDEEIAWLKADCEENIETAESILQLRELAIVRKGMELCKSILEKL